VYSPVPIANSYSLTSLLATWKNGLGLCEHSFVTF
jgi:hypothetical protein